MWIICFSIVVRYFSYGVLPLGLLVFLGFYLIGYQLTGRLEELVGDTFFKCLEFGTILCDIDYLEGDK